MSASQDEAPYRAGDGGTQQRLADLEHEVALLRRVVAGTDPPRVVALRRTHLREDRALLVAGYRTMRRVILPGTTVAMLLTFALFYRAAGLHPKAIVGLWLACALAECVVAATGLSLDALLHARARRRCREIDYRLAEQGALAGAEPSQDARHEEDPLAFPATDPIAALEAPAVRIATR